MGLKERIKSLFIREDKAVISPAAPFYRFGEPHPYSFEDYEEFYKTDPVVRSSINILAEMIVGGGYHLVSEDEKAEEKVSTFLDKVHFETLILEAVKDMFVYGNAFIEKVWENNELVKLKLLPPKTMRVLRDKYGKVIGYVQVVNGETVNFEPHEIMHLKYDPIGNSAYGLSLIHPVVELLRIKKQVIEDIALILHRYAAPKIIWKAPNPSAAKELADTLSVLAPDEDIIVTDNIEAEPIKIDPQARFEYFIEYLDRQIFEGLGAPQLWYIRNATQASAEIMNDIVSNRVQAIQKYLKREIEEEIIKPLAGDKVRFEWGIPRSEVEILNISDIANLVHVGAITPFQAQELLIKMGIPLPKEEVESLSESLYNTLNIIVEQVFPKPQIIDAGPEIWYVIYPYDYFAPNTLRKITLDKANGVYMVVGTMPKLGMRFIHKFVFQKIKGWDEGKVRDYIKAHFSWW
ncbi:MAG: hypothetical protein DRN04_13085 [Thermoprotei archaeon]|nr:MAG: hypothetical protein DRN04_13085 [Thermoprotei archaeon]